MQTIKKYLVPFILITLLIMVTINYSFFNIESGNLERTCYLKYDGSEKEQ